MKESGSPFTRLSGLLNVAGLFLAWLILFGVLSFYVPTFLTWRNIETIARQTTIVGIASLGMTCVIVAGAIDLSIGSLVALITVVIATLLQADFSPVLAMIGGIGVGLAAGIFNGLLVTRVRLVPFIATLSTLLIFRGIAKGLGKEQKVNAPATWLSDWLAVLPPERKWMLFPPGVWLLLALTVLTMIFLRNTVQGRNVYAIGGNETAARFSAVNVEGVKLLVFGLSGLFAGIAGLMMFARLTVGDPTVAVGLELEVIAAVVIGGASLSGGTGSVVGSLLGAFIMATIASGGSQLGWPNWVQEIVTGGIIVVAVILDRIRNVKARQ